MTSPAIVNETWVELDSRSGGGFDVSLLWRAADQQVKVRVTDRRLGFHFELDAASADALTAFHHPFAYVAHSER